tara:strand:- start:1074 stop:1541 length:468 start_codon:yes stop_codon:yes gene_type:complete
MPNYQNSKIYKIVCDETNLIYYGSTTKKYLSSRLAGHRYDFKNGNGNGIQGMSNPKIYLIEKFPCECREELHARERFFIENNECINIVIPLQTKKEYRQNNKEKIEKQNKEWRENNLDKWKQKKTEWSENHKEKMKAYHKDYYQKNRIKKNIENN